MPVDYTTAIINDQLQVVVDAIDAGASNGWMRLLDGGGNVLSSFQLARPMGTVAGGVLSFNGLALIDLSAAAGGVATMGRCEDGDGNIVITGLVVGQDITMTPTSTIVAGQVLALTVATITGQ